ncbi:MAG: TetR/AcrR family transcriptional regulator [Acidimicrobiales bacterium]
MTGYVATVSGSAPSTHDRVSEAALLRFADQGVAATSLDDLARSIGVTKQTVLYHFGSKDGLVRAVAQRGANELAGVLGDAAAHSEPGWDRVESIVRAAFGLAVQRPELLSLMREVSRLGAPVSEVVLADLQPLIDRALGSLSEGMAAGVFKTADPRLLLVSAYAAVAGVVTDPEALRAVGLELDVRVAARLRRTVLDFLAASLLPTR